MQPLIRFVLDKAVFMNLVFLGIIAYGSWALATRMPVDRYPNIQFGEINITTPYPGASAEDVERLVTQEIEDAIRGMADLEYVSARSMSGRSEIKVKFLDDTDYDNLYDDLRLRVTGVQNRLPVRDGKPLQPQIVKIEVDEWLPVLQVNLIAADREHPLDTRALTLLAKELQTRLETIDGIKKVSLLGDRYQQFSLAVDPDALQQHGITFAEVTRALRDSGSSRPAGTLATAAGERTIRLDTRYRTRDDLSAVVIKRDGDGNYLRIGDILDHPASGVRNVKDGVITRVNGMQTVACKVLKNPEADARRIKQAVLVELSEFHRAHADDGVETIITLDSTIQINDQIGILSWSLTSGALLVAATLLVFLNFRAGVVTVAGVAFAFIGSLGYFYFTGRSLNELSLLGFVLVVGIIVDDAIIVLENIQRHREHGERLREATIRATAEVFWPVVSATLTSIASFLPLLLMTGAIGEFFALIPVAVTVALMFSLIECLFILPIHVVDLERLLGRSRIVHESDAPADSETIFTKRRGFVGYLHRRYDRALKWNLNHPLISLGSVGLLFALAIGCIVYSQQAPLHNLPPLLRFKFFPDDTSMVAIRVQLPDGTAHQTTDALIRDISFDLIDRGAGEIANTTSFAGMLIGTDYAPQFANQIGFIQAQLAPVAKRTFEDPNRLIDDIRTAIQERYAVSKAQISVEAQQDGPPTGKPVNVRVTGPDEEAVKDLADDLLAWMTEEAAYHATLPDDADPQKVATLLKDTTIDEPLSHAMAMRLRYAEMGATITPGQLPGVVSLKHNQDRYQNVVGFRPDQSLLAQMGLAEGVAFDFLSGAFDGIYVGDFRRSDEDIPVRVTFAPASVADPADILDLPIIDDPSGRLIRFADIGSIRSDREPAMLTRRDFQRTITITGDLAADAALSAGNVSTRVANWYQEHVADYPGATIAFGGEQESTLKSYESLVLAFALASFCIYLILATQFNSYGQPLLIMSNIIFSFTGVVLVMSLFGFILWFVPAGMIRPERTWFTVNSFISIVGLTGLVVNDAIVLMDFINQRRRAGLPLRQALVLAGHQRMRPIFMTTITTIAGLLPMALGLPRFNMAWTPFATCFVSGLFMATAMTLLVVPVIYERYEWCLNLLRTPPPPPVPATPAREEEEAVDSDDLMVVVTLDEDDATAPTNPAEDAAHQDRLRPAGDTHIPDPSDDQSRPTD